MGKKKAFIIGSEGQDGMLLKSFLHSKDYIVCGLGRSNCSDLSILEKYLKIDLLQEDQSQLYNFIIEEKPDEIYYVAAFHQSSQEQENNQIELIKKSVKINQLEFINLMEVCRLNHPNARIIYTSSSLIFSGSGQQIQDEITATAPRCIYSVTKCAAMEAAEYYREFYGLFVSIGIMYNHESILRKDYFLSKKIINETKKLLNGNLAVIRIGNLEAMTDWGYAPDYVRALWHILQLPLPDTFIVSSGMAHKVKDWFHVLFDYLKMDWRQYVEEDNTLLIRVKPILIGNNSKLTATGWFPSVSFDEMVIKMYKSII